MSNVSISKRTFGIEFEFADVEKSKVNLPKGFVWNKEETITNTNLTKGSGSSKFGGEINTPPLELSTTSFIAIKDLLASCRDAGGKVTWLTGLHIHIWIGDFSVEELKKLFSLTYYTATLIRECWHDGGWNHTFFCSPIPTLEFFNNVNKATTYEEVWKAFESSTNKGYMRHIVNVPSFFKRETVEFRFYNATMEIEEVWAAVMFAYRFVDFSLRNKVEDYKSINSVLDFRQKLKLRGDIAKPIPPLLFSGNQEHPIEAFRSKHVEINNNLISVLCEKTEDEIALVNPHLYRLELSLCQKKKVTIYNNDELNHIIYRIANGELTLRYSGQAEFLQTYYDTDPVRQITLLMIFNKARKFFQDTDFARMTLEGIVSSVERSIAKLEKGSQSLVQLLTSCEYKTGTLLDALNNEKAVFFQFDDYGKHRSAVQDLRIHTNYDGEYQIKKFSYYGITENIPSGVHFFIASKNEFLNLNKVAKSGSVTLYSSVQNDNKISIESKKDEQVNFPEPPDDLVIEDVTKLKICHIKPSIFSYLQKKYVVKVHKTVTPRFPYIIIYDKYLLGGFGFELAKMPNYDIWLLSDFCTNNRIKRLSKLILLCIKSKSVQRSLSRRNVGNVGSCYTKVYTHQPVSMKYRGLFDKQKSEEPNFLLYTTELGEVKDEEIIEKYTKYKER